MMWLIILVVVAGLMVLAGLWKTYEAEGRDLVRKPGCEMRTLSDGAPMCDVLGCQREAIEYDGDRHMWLCEKHSDSDMQPQLIRL
jgi:hypothetical protein